MYTLSTHKSFLCLIFLIVGCVESDAPEITNEFVLDFALLEPKDSSVDIEPGHTFSWGKSAQAIEYELILESNVHNTSIANISGSSITVNDLRYGTQYFWKIVARDQGGQEVETPLFNFHTKINFYVEDEQFSFPQLNTTRRILVYLPPDYQKSNLSYPVLYLHDGQDVFEPRTGGLQVDELLDEIFHLSEESIIVVAIDHSEDRSAEYAPWVSEGKYYEEFAGLGGNGDKYIEFIVNSLKPYIDNTFRTLVDKNNTGIAGFSLGGLISLYATLEYPEVFGKGGFLSPSITFVDDKMFEYAEDHASALSPEHFLYFFAGELEVFGEDSFPENNQRMIELLESKNESNYLSTIHPNGGHDYQTWQVGIRQMINWFYFD